MKKITDSKIFWMLISLLASLAFWIYITSTVSDEITRTFSGIPVELIGEDVLQNSKGMTITDLNTNTVSVNVSGPRRIVSGLSSNLLSAQIDVSKLSQSAYATMQYTIAFPSGIDQSSLSVSRKSPESINFTVSKLVSKEIPVRGSFDGNVADGYTAESVVFEPSTITITGSENSVNNISYAWVSFGSEEISSTYTEEAGFVLLDEFGNQLDNTGIQCSVDVIKATQPILMLKEVPLSINVNYGAGANEHNVVITIEPNVISLAGDSKILNGLNKIVLGTVDLTSFESTYTENYTIPIDNELRNLKGISQATVNIEILGLTTKMFEVTNISFTNLTDGYSADIDTEKIDVKIRGTEEQLGKISDGSIRAVADLTDYNETTGTTTVPAKIYIDGVTDVGAIGSYTITLNIKKVS